MTTLRLASIKTASTAKDNVKLYYDFRSKLSLEDFFAYQNL